MDGHGYCDIHGHCDRGVCTVVSIHGHCDRGVCTVVSIHGWSWMITATVAFMDAVTEGYAQWCPSMDGHGWSWQQWHHVDTVASHGYCDRGVCTVVSSTNYHG